MFKILIFNTLFFVSFNNKIFSTICFFKICFKFNTDILTQFFWTFPGYTLIRPFFKSGLLIVRVQVEVKSVGRSTEKVELMRTPFSVLKSFSEKISVDLKV